ncbi:acetyltransferase (GNAT) family protein [Georgenia soli]|uniref:Acetyltransferase (GNAT) family protein n=1 Tax=Georgenia soli TaxID=638953 RepID=A0A2A9EM86_9MICO|nr:GNAT family N-acetyltransferase [Georgenia soli]PFG39641.1 acetyltransferase (GNAT) family protein [Georgenia soli]
MEMRVVEVPRPPHTDAPASAAVQAWHEVFAESMRAVLGHDDFADPPAALVAMLAEQRHAARTLLVALRDGAGAGDDAGASLPSDPADVLGYAWFSLPRTDNHHLAEAEVVVRPAARHRGVGTALWHAAEERIRAAGRATVTTWTSHAAEAPEGSDAVVPRTGVGRIPADDDAARFARRHGFALEQGERQSTLHLPVDPDRVTAWRGEAEAVAGPDYRLVQWTDRAPEEWLDSLAELQRRMSVDVPLGGLDFREEAWDAQRIRDMEEELAGADQRYVLSAAEHVPGGELVAFTYVVLPRSRPEVAYQYNTLVHGEHRGRRLGLLVKAANLQLLATTQPALRRLHTWNAGENRHMLAINERMGFVPASLEGAWQRRYDGEAD